VLGVTIVFLGTICRGATIMGTVKGVDGTPFQGAFVEAQVRAQSSSKSKNARPYSNASKTSGQSGMDAIDSG